MALSLVLLGCKIIRSPSMSGSTTGACRRKKTPTDKVYFKWMLENINVLYLNARVLILLDLSYLSRFWTQYEAWLSMQTATKEGLRPATVDERRYEIKAIYNTNELLGKSLEVQWANKTPHDAFNSLKMPDVMVTNNKDKGDQLPKILEFDAKVRHAFTSKVDAFGA